MGGVLVGVVVPRQPYGLQSQFSSAEARGFGAGQ